MHDENGRSISHAVFVDMPRRLPNSKAIYASDLDQSGWKPRTRDKYHEQCVDFATPRFAQEVWEGEQKIKKHDAGRKRHNSKKLQAFYDRIRIMSYNGYGDFKHSNEQLAKEFKVSPRTITRWIHSLKELNLLSYVAVPVPKDQMRRQNIIAGDDVLEARFKKVTAIQTSRIIRVHSTHIVCGWRNERVGFRRDFRQIDQEFIDTYTPKERWDAIPLDHRVHTEGYYYQNGQQVWITPVSQKYGMRYWVNRGLLTEEFYEEFQRFKDLGTGPQPREAKKNLPTDYCRAIGYGIIQKKKRFNKFLKELKKEDPKFYKEHMFIHVPKKYIRDKDGYIDDYRLELPKVPTQEIGDEISGNRWNFAELKRRYNP